MLDQFAKKLLSGGHYDTVAISKRRDAVLARCVCVWGGGVRVCVCVCGVCVVCCVCVRDVCVTIH